MKNSSHTLHRGSVAAISLTSFSVSGMGTAPGSAVWPQHTTRGDLPPSASSAAKAFLGRPRAPSSVPTVTIVGPPS